MAPCHAGDVHDERRRLARLRRRWREAAQPGRRTAGGDGRRRDGAKRRGGDAGSGSVDRAGPGAPEACPQVCLGPLIRQATGLLALCLVLVACSTGSNSSTASRPRTTPTPSPPISAEWTEYHRDAGRSGVGPAEPALAGPRGAWNVPGDAAVYASPLVRSGHLIAAAYNKNAHSL